MKKVLITGKNSYIGSNLKNWLSRYPNKYLIETISLRNNKWKEKEFKSYDVVFHCVGLAHVRETKNNSKEYYTINRDLTCALAKKAQEDGVKHFIFLSSMSVYGIEKGIIGKNTQPNPKSNYGKSKLQAEILLKDLESESFKITILRPPMIYGKGCRGNYNRLSKLAIMSPLFPNIENKRSMLYIDNLCEASRIIIDYQIDGVFMPQDKEYVKTSNMVSKIAEVNGKSIKLFKFFNPIFKNSRSSLMNKVFGDLIYDKGFFEHNMFRGIKFVGFEESIRRTEEKHEESSNTI